MKKWGITRRSIGIIILCVALVAGGVSAWVFRDAIARLFTSQQTEEPVDEPNETPAGDQVPDVGIDEATEREINRAVASGDSSSAVAIYDKKIAQSDDPMVTAELYIQKAVALVNSGKLQEAIQAAKQAEAIELTERAASLLAFLYEQAGDNQEAVKYYTLALELLDTDNDARDKKGQFTQKIGELGGG